MPAFRKGETTLRRQGRILLHDPPKYWGCLEHSGVTYGETDSRPLELIALEPLPAGYHFLVFKSPGHTGWSGIGLTSYYPMRLHAFIVRPSEEGDVSKGITHYSIRADLGDIAPGRSKTKGIFFIEETRRNALAIIKDATGKIE